MCRVAWHLRFNDTTFRCAYCTKYRGGCSFRKMAFGIVKRPALKKTKEGDARRAQNNLEGRISRGKKKDAGLSLGTTKIRPSTSSSTTPHVSRTARRKGKSKQEPRPPSPSYARLGERSYVDLSRFHTILSSSQSTSISMRQALRDLRRIQAQEQEELEAATTLVEERSLSMDDIMEKLEGKLAAQEVMVTQEMWSSEDGANLPDWDYDLNQPRAGPSGTKHQR